jgi:hypothetical protein
MYGRKTDVTPTSICMAGLRLTKEVNESKWDCQSYLICLCLFNDALRSSDIGGIGRREETTGKTKT